MTEQDRKADAAAFAAALRPLVNAASAALDEMENPNDAGEEAFDRACERAPLAYGEIGEQESIYDSPPREQPYHEVCDSPECDRCRSCRCEERDCPMCATSARIVAKAGMEREADALAEHAAGMAKLEPGWPKPQLALVERTYRVKCEVFVDLSLTVDSNIADASDVAARIAEQQIRNALTMTCPRSLPQWVQYHDIEAMEVEEKK